jgi:AcrR family transcriptional regulator
MARRGRRPGDQGTRDAILTAARAVFIEEGFNKATVTGVARRAEVDAALIYHYFGTKVDLFIEATAGLPYPGGLAAVADGHVPDGTEIVTAFLRQWEQGPEPPGQAFVALAQAASGSPEAAAGLLRFVTERIWGGLPGQGHAGGPGGGLSGDAARRAAMVGSQLVGIAWARYILRLEPVASASLDDVAAWFGPTIDSYRAGTFAEAPGSGHQESGRNGPRTDRPPASPRRSEDASGRTSDRR